MDLKNVKLTRRKEQKGENLVEIHSVIADITLGDAMKINRLKDNKDVKFNLEYSDKRIKTYEQIKLAHKIIKDFMFYKNITIDIEYFKQALYNDYIVDKCLVSFRMKTAKLNELNQFIDWLIKEFAHQGYFVSGEDAFINSTLYAGLSNKRCCVCGTSDAKILMRRKRVISLCDTHIVELSENKDMLKENHLHWLKVGDKELELLINTAIKI